MRTPNGFDRISTPEELNQVLAVLGEFARSTWASLGEEVDSTPWLQTPIEDEEAESLAEFVINKPELKN
jgi:hypothetical protein